MEQGDRRQMEIGGRRSKADERGKEIGGKWMKGGGGGGINGYQGAA